MCSKIRNHKGSLTRTLSLSCHLCGIRHNLRGDRLDEDGEILEEIFGGSALSEGPRVQSGPERLEATL